MGSSLRLGSGWVQAVRAISVATFKWTQTLLNHLWSVLTFSLSPSQAFSTLLSPSRMHHHSARNLQTASVDVVRLRKWPYQPPRGGSWVSRLTPSGPIANPCLRERIWPFLSQVHLLFITALAVPLCQLLSDHCQVFPPHTRLFAPVLHPTLRVPFLQPPCGHATPRRCSRALLDGSSHSRPLPPLDSAGPEAPFTAAMSPPDPLMQFPPPGSWSPCVFLI